MAEIRIEGKDVAGTLGLADHLYLVFVANSGDEFVIRGGPTRDDIFDFGPIDVEPGTFMSVATTEDYRPISDRADHGSKVLDLNGRDAADVWATMRTMADLIDKATVAYSAFGPNSNSVVASVLHAVGINVATVLPDTPGIDNYVGYTDAMTTQYQRVFAAAATSDGKDILVGGSRDDLFVAGSGNDTLKGGGGVDTLVYWHNTASQDVTVNLGNSGVNALSGPTGGDRVSGIENVGGGAGNDTLIGNSLANLLFGWTGRDLLVGNGGNDILIGSGSAGDSLQGGAGSDVLDGGPGGASVLNGGADTDVFCFRDNYGRTTIVDFEPGVDAILIFGSTNSTGGISTAQTGAGLELSFSGNTVLLEGLMTDTVPDHFIFV